MGLALGLGFASEEKEKGLEGEEGKKGKRGEDVDL
jgi:hypothetical protein